MSAIPNFWIKNIPPLNLSTRLEPSCIIARVSWKRGSFQRIAVLLEASGDFDPWCSLAYLGMVCQIQMLSKSYRNSGIYHIVLVLKAPWHSQTSQPTEILVRRKTRGWWCFLFGGILQKLAVQSIWTICTHNIYYMYTPHITMTIYHIHNISSYHLSRVQTCLGISVPMNEITPPVPCWASLTAW